MRKRQSKGVGRPRAYRKINFDPKVVYFKPRGLPLAQLKEIDLSVEELEALRLKNIKELDQNDCAKAMKTSQSTFQRILSGAYKKISQALVEGRAIRILKK